MMFHCAGNNVPPLRLEEAGGAEDCQVAALGAAAGEDDFAGFARPDTGDPIPGVIEQRAGTSADMVDTGRIAENLAEIRQHGLAYHRVERRGGVVVEVNGAHEEW